jgi:16S rRNA G966 N2-methylase RsmD
MSLFPNRPDASGPIECLGQTFPSEVARRQHFIGMLRAKLADPEFRRIEGFPVATDEDILALSDPPYFTACPNPFIPEFIARYGKPYDAGSGYSREPLTVDVQEGKTDALYKAHGYHTKVPHLAIVPSILHYTEPGNVVLDGFCGSGMTGVAAQWCGAAPVVYRAKLEAEWKALGKRAPKWGPRRVVLNDLSPAAAFIAANYNIPFDVETFAKTAKKLLAEVAAELGWMYQTRHTDGRQGHIDYTVWSEVFSCPSCAGEIVFSTEALDLETKRVRLEFPCPHCGTSLTKDNLERVFESRTDPASGEPWRRVKLRPTLISYTVAGVRLEKAPDADDIDRLAKIEAMELPAGIPTNRFPIEAMYHGSRIAPKGFTHVHHFFLPRAGHGMAALWGLARAVSDVRLRNMLLWYVEQAIWGMSVLARYAPTHFSQVNQYLNGVYYIASQHAECSPWYILEGKLKRLESAFRTGFAVRDTALTTVGSATSLQLPNDSVDYIFTDPPFGENIFYADLNFLVESWQRVLTDSKPEAIVDHFKDKELHDYHTLMRLCFEEYHRVLKPGRWMTVVFSNSSAAVWNAIQAALQQAGFVVANVSAMDKQQGSYRQVTSTTAVKQDLVISAYKPNGGLEDRFARAAGNEDSAWDFVRTHLKYLPSVKLKEGELEFIAERDPRVIFDRMVAFFVRHNFSIPVSSQEFQAGLSQRFAERDGMVFLPEQVTEYDRKRMQTASAPQMEFFISDERSAIDWLTDFLRRKPSTYQEVHPEFIKQLGAGWKKHEAKPELSELLEGNFLRYDQKAKDGQDVPAQIHSYLSSNWATLRNLDKDDARLKTAAADRWFVPDPTKAQELEKVREKSLLKEFETYKAHTGRKLKEFRLEVMRTGFKTCWGNRDYATIIAVAKKVPDDVLQEDEKLLLWYDQALTRMEEA